MMRHSSSSLHHPVSPHPRANAARGENGTRSPMRVKLLLRTVAHMFSGFAEGTETSGEGVQTTTCTETSTPPGNDRSTALRDDTVVLVVVSTSDGQQSITRPAKRLNSEGSLGSVSSSAMFQGEPSITAARKIDSTPKKTRHSQLCDYYLNLYCI